MSQVKKTIKITSALIMSLVLTACVVTDRDYLACTSALHREIIRSQSELNEWHNLNKFDRYAPYSSKQYPKIKEHHFHKDNNNPLNPKSFNLDERFQPRLSMPVSPNKRSHSNLIDQRMHAKIQQNNALFQKPQHDQAAQRPMQHRSFKNTDLPPQARSSAHNNPLPSDYSQRTKRHDPHEPINQQAFVAKRPVQHQTTRKGNLPQ